METASRSEHLVSFKSFELDLHTRELRRNGRLVKLHGHPIDVLAMLLERPGKLVTREELQRRLWPKDTFVDFEQILNNSIGKLRDALGDRAEEPRFIETLPRLGYRFIAPVTIGSDRQCAPETPSTDPAMPRAGDDSDPLLTPTGRLELAASNRWHWGAATVMGLVVPLTIASIIYVSAHRRVTSPQGGTTAIRIQPVTNAPGSAIFPVFSPDEREIAFLWDGPERKRFDLYVLLIGSDTPLRLTYSADGVLGAPAWSPDGREIAFSRCNGRDEGVYVVPALGGTERKLTHAGCPDAEPGQLAWLPNGQEMLMIDHCPDGGTFDLVVFSLASGDKRCLTYSGRKNTFDSVYHFSLSPDARTVAFVAAAAAPCFGDIYTIPFSGGIPHPLTLGGRCFGDLTRSSSALMWTPDSKSIVFVSRQSTLPSLWRVPAHGGTAQRETFYPAIGSISKDGRRLVYPEQTVVEGPAIWRADLKTAVEPVLKNREFIRTQFAEMAPQVSPDSTRIAWRSDRTGYGQIWTSNTNGEAPSQLTHLDWYSGVPRWSPDGKWIAFNQVADNERQIFIVNSEGMGLRQITHGPYANADSSWSRDGRSIYFSSMRTGSWQVWRHSLDDGAERQITVNGGFDPFESYDGHTVYFSKIYQAGIWSVSASGGTELLVVPDRPQIGYWGYWGISKAGLYVLNTEAKSGPRIEFYEFATRRIFPVFTLAKKPWALQSSLSVTGDGKTIYYVLYDHQSVIKMMEVPR